MSRPRRQLFIALVAGVLFAVGLALGGMTQPGKVIAFFDFSSGLVSWDPSLAFVMLGGMLVYVPVFRTIKNHNRPFFAERFHLPTRKDIDRPLVLGAALFGAGWGLAGYCPGPAMTSFGAGSKEALLVGIAMLVGMKAYQWTTDFQQRRAPLPPSVEVEAQ